MDISDDMVDVLFIYDDLAVAALNELLHELVGRAIIFNGIDFRSRDHAVAHFCIREFQCILKDPHLVFNIFFILRVVDTLLENIVQVYFRESFLIGFIDILYSEYTEKSIREKGRELADGPQYNIKDVS